MWNDFLIGMRALLVLFFNIVPCKRRLVRRRCHGCMELILCLFISLLIGGFLADRYLGYPGLLLGALAMTLGHASMAVETPLFLYIELGFLL
jgi:POT family proton-dependent oligopeptide transporter